MSKGRLSFLLDHLCRHVAPATSGEVSDAELLQRFALHRDEAAFELLVWRHGPAILGLCRRLLHHEQDAEDAFQATFLVLVRKARSIGKREALASWLYKVAYRIACRARPRAAVFFPHGVAFDELASRDSDGDVIRRDLRAMLDEEVAALPESYRRPIILCYLEGKTNDEAARLLGWPIGTVATRLARARERLRAVLAQRGWTLSGAALATVLADQLTASPISAELVRGTVRAGLAHAAGPAAAAGVVSAKALALSEGVLRLMWYSKVKLAAVAILAVTLAGSGIGWAVHHAWAAAEPEPAREVRVDPPAEDRDGQADAQEAAVAQGFGSKTGVSAAEIRKLRDEISQLRSDLAAASREINALKEALRKTPPTQEPPAAHEPLYRGRPVRSWLEQANDGDPSYRKDAIVALGALAMRNKELVKELLPVLLGALKDPDPDLPQRTARVSVGQAAVAALASVGGAAVPGLAEIAKAKPARHVRLRVLQTLGSIGTKSSPTVPWLIDTLEEEDVELRRAAASALAGIGPGAKASLPALVKALKDEDEEVNRRAMDALASMKSEAKPALPALVEVMGERVKEFEKKFAELTKRKGGGAPPLAPPGSYPGSYSSFETPDYVLQIVLIIDPSVRNVLPEQDPPGFDRRPYWSAAYQVLRKKYALNEK